MVDLLGQGHKLILEKRRWDDYASMKQYFQNSDTKEVLFAGDQVLTTTFATMDGGHFALGLTRLAAEAMVYLSTALDDANQDLKSVWVVYQDDTGAIQDTLLCLLEDTADTTIEVPLGHEDIFDTCASVAGDVITMTAMAATLNQYAGWYTIGKSGDGDQIGVANLIISNTAHGTTPAFTLTDTPNANTATDVIMFQQYVAEDFYRVREMYCEVEVIDTMEIRLGDSDSTNVYATIGVGQRYMLDSGIFTQPTAVCDTYLGRIKGSTGIDTTVTEVKSASIQVFYTPFEAHSDGGAVETVIELPFQTNVCWEPCIKLAPATDVTIRVKYTAGAAIDKIFVETAYLEVYK